MLKKLSVIILVSLLSVNLAACVPQQNNVQTEATQKYASLSVEDIPSRKEYRELPFNEKMALRVAMEKLPLDECEKDAERYLSACLKEDQVAELLNVSFTKDELTMVKGENKKTLENLYVDIDAKLLPSDDPEFKPMDVGNEVITSIRNYLDNYTYATLMSNLHINVFYDYGIANTSNAHISYVNVQVYKELGEAEYATQTIAYKFSKQNRDFSLLKFGAIPETGELYIEYYVTDDFLLDEKVKPDRHAALEEKYRKIKEQLLKEESTEQYIKENDLTSLTVSFQNSFLEDGYMTFHEEL